VLALTDHDTLDGLVQARAAMGSEMELIPGVEISVTWHGLTVHVLGLGVDPDNLALKKGLQGLQEFRSWRAREIARKLQLRGINGALEGARRFCKGAILSRTHFAHFLVDSGHASSVRDVFRKFLVKGRPGYVNGQWASLSDAVDWIRQAGGLAVIAHPARYRLTRSRLRALMIDFRDAGGVGLEVVSGCHSADETRCMAAVSREHNLYASVGSDYHGPEKPWVDLGRLLPLPEGCAPIWEAALWSPANRRIEA
jgi:predicted metal-dependent phosphoesterase TrpH